MPLAGGWHSGELKLKPGLHRDSLHAQVNAAFPPDSRQAMMANDILVAAYPDFDGLELTAMFESLVAHSRTIKKVIWFEFVFA